MIISRCISYILRHFENRIRWTDKCDIISTTNKELRRKKQLWVRERGREDWERWGAEWETQWYRQILYHLCLLKSGHQRGCLAINSTWTAYSWRKSERIANFQLKLYVVQLYYDTVEMNDNCDGHLFHSLIIQIWDS